MSTLSSGSSGFGKTIARATIVAATIAAAGGIAVVLRGGERPYSEFGILDLTVLIGFASLIVLCCWTRSGRLGRLAGVSAVVMALLAPYPGLITRWFESMDNALPRVLMSVGFVAFFVAFALLLLGLEVADRVAKLVLALTILFVAVLAATYLAMLLPEDAEYSDTFGRFRSIVTILAALGTIVSLCLSRLKPRREARVADGVPFAGDLRETPAARRLADIATHENHSREDVLAAALNAYEAAPSEASAASRS